jgi:nitronate monooxygenase
MTSIFAPSIVPVIITSLSAPGDVVPLVHAWGGLVFHDVISVRHRGQADGLILVCAGAGGHAGTLSPFALVECANFGQGTVVLAGAIANGRGVLAARAMGADLAYVGTRFIAAREANADLRHKEMIVASAAQASPAPGLFRRMGRSTHQRDRLGV